MNGTGAKPRVEAAGARGPSLHVTFGVETAHAGTYESLLHHALEVAAVEHPLLFGLPPHPQGVGETSVRRGCTLVPMMLLLLLLLLFPCRL